MPRKKRAGFTLIELLISIMILSILMLFLYKSYSGLNRSNATVAAEIKKLQAKELVRETIFMDITLALKDTLKILKQDRNEDVLFMRTSHSVHKRINPYVAYIMKEGILYRLESLKPLKEYPLSADAEFSVDKLGSVKSFRTYASKDAKSGLYLVHILFKNKEELLLKVKAFNSI